MKSVTERVLSSVAVHLIAIGSITGVTTAHAAPPVRSDSAVLLRTCSTTFTDDPLVPDVTPLKAIHVTELRAVIDCLRLAQGLSAYGWTDPSLAVGQTLIRDIHILDLRTALNQAYSQAGKMPPVYTDPDLAGQPLKAVYLEEIRTATKVFNSDPRLAVEIPSEFSSVTQPFTISGWALDLAATSGVGVDMVRVRAIRTGTTTELSWGNATFGLSRPDIAALYGTQFDNSGYTISISGKASGQYTIFVDAHSVSSGIWNTASIVLLVDTPVNLTVGRQGTGTGGVSGVGLSCSGGGSSQAVPCGAAYAPNTTVSLSAQPDSGSTFDGWSGACSGTSTCAVTMTAARYVQANFAGPLTTQTKQYYHSDALGSVRAVTDESAAVISRHDYQPFGEDAAVLSGDPRRFTNKERDQETALDYFGARYHRSLTARFTTVDPVQVTASLVDPQRWNRYSYARNNPLRYVDHQGLYVFDPSVTDKDKQKFRDALETAKNAANALSGSQRDAVQAAIAAYGDEGTPGVTVAFGPLNKNVAGDTKGMGLDPSTLEGQVLVTFDTRHSNELAIDVAHEGSHAEDFLTYYKALAADPASLAGVGKVAGGPLDLTKYETERRAYNVSAYVAIGLHWPNLIVGNQMIMDRGAIDQTAISRFLKTSPNYGLTPTNPGPRIGGIIR